MTTSNRHWIVGGDASRWYSLDAKGYMPADQSWLDLGFVPSTAVDEATLWATVADIDPSGIASDNAAGQAAVTGRTKLAIDAERDRRRNLPISITTSPTGAFQINMDDISQQNIAGLATAGIVLSNAAPTQTTAFRDLANVTHSLLPSELVSMGLQVMAHIGALYAKSWALKAMSPIPADYAADSYWS
jgi:hypothetical protein